MLFCKRKKAARAVRPGGRWWVAKREGSISLRGTFRHGSSHAGTCGIRYISPLGAFTIKDAFLSQKVTRFFRKNRNFVKINGIQAF